jgi:phospholipid/cholesterol/gamma-HCH transport system permease protein
MASSGCLPWPAPSPSTGTPGATGAATEVFVVAAADFAGFVGEAWLAIGRLTVGRARLRAGDFLLAIEDCGPGALPIAALVNFLVGLILAFVGAIELRQFGSSSKS